MKHLLFYMLCLFLSNTLHGQIHLNEVLVQNDSLHLDNRGLYSDWIELYNTGDSAIALEGYGLSDRSDAPFKWRFPDTSIAAQGYLVVYASNLDSLTETKIHCNFKLSAQDRYLLLHDADSNLVSTLNWPYISDNISFGRIDAYPTPVRLHTPTPNAPNPISAVLHDIQSSHASGKHNVQAIDVSLTCPSLPSCPVYYTLDGSTPSLNTQRYERPIHLDDLNAAPNDISYTVTSPVPNNDGSLFWQEWNPPLGKIPKAQVLRAQAICPDSSKSEVFLGTYFLGESGHEHVLPVFSIVLPESSLFDPDTGIYVPGNLYEPSNLKTGNYFQTGKPWERKAALEFFPHWSKATVNQKIGLRIHGNLSRVSPQKSLRLYARSELGSKRFYYPFFGEDEQNSFKRLMLRNAYSALSGSILTDPFITSLSSSLETVAQQPSALYLNGRYWGIHHIRERPDRHYLKDHFPEIDKTALIICEFNGDSIYGDPEPLNKLHFFVAQRDLSIQENYDSLGKLLDIPNTIDYLIYETFFANMDWPFNNQRLWKPSKDSGLFRWFLYDLDAAFLVPPDFDALSYALDSKHPVWSNHLFQKLFNNPDFTSAFIDRYIELLNTELGSAHTLSTLQQMVQKIEPEVALHCYRWQYPEDEIQWEYRIGLMQEFLTVRPCLIAQQLEARFQTPVAALLSCKHKTSSPDELHVFPVPASTRFYVDHPYTEAEEAQLTLINMQGQLVYDVQHTLNPDNSRILLYIPELLPGQYVLSVATAQGKAHKTIVVGNKRTYY